MAQANIKAVITAEDRASSVLKGFGNSVENASDRIATGAKRAALALVAAGTAATTFAVKSAADFEQTRIGLENMLGSADAARAMLAKVSKFAAETPFEFPELAQATRQLVAFGFSGEDAFKTMTQLGDVSAAIGAPINDLAYLMGTLRAQGRAFTIDIRQFAMRGIPIYEYLAKVMKTNTKELTELIETGKIGFPEVQKAFEMMTAEGGKFHGTMAKQSKSLSGLFSTLKDSIGMTARELVGITQEGDIKEGSLFDGLRKGTAWLIENLPKLIEQMKQIIRDIIPQLQQWASNVANVARQISEYLGPKLDELWQKIQEIMPTFKEWFEEILVPLSVLLGQTLVLAIGALIDALTQAVEYFGVYMKVVLETKNSIQRFWEEINRAYGVVREKFELMKEVFNGINPAVKAAVSGVADMLMGPFDEAFGSIIKSIDRVLDKIGGLKKAIGGVNEGAKAFNLVNLAKTILPGFAAGTTYAPGGMALVGEQGPEIVNLPRGSKVTPNNQIGNGSTVNINVNVGMYAGTEMEKRKIAASLARAYQDAMGANSMAWGS